jgi:hypothetical protein
VLSDICQDKTRLRKWKYGISKIKFKKQTDPSFLGNTINEIEGPDGVGKWFVWMMWILGAFVVGARPFMYLIPAGQKGWAPLISPNKFDRWFNLAIPLSPVFTWILVRILCNLRVHARRCAAVYRGSGMMMTCRGALTWLHLESWPDWS